MKRFSKEWFNYLYNKYEQLILLIGFIIGIIISYLIKDKPYSLYISYGASLCIIIFVTIRLLIIYKKK